MAPIPIALCGKNLQLAAGFTKGMLPECEVVHVCHDTTSAKTEFPALLRGENIEPSSDMGSNAQSGGAPKIPRLVFVGAGFTKAELEDMMSTPGLETLPWTFSKPETISSVQKKVKTSGRPAMGFIVEIAKQKFEEIGLVPGKEDQVKAGLHWL